MDSAHDHNQQGVSIALAGALVERLGRNMRVFMSTEGPLPADWVAELERRGIAVQQGLMRDHARDVLREYGAGGIVY